MNKVASILKQGSIVLFILGVLGAVTLSFKTDVTLDTKKYTYDKTQSFDFPTMLTLVFASAISCTLTYAFGELIDIEDKKRKYLIARFGDVEPKVESENITLTYTVNHTYDDVDKNIKTLIDNKSLENLGYKYEGNNSSTKSYFFKISDVKVEVTIKSKDDKTTSLSASTTNKITSDNLRTKMEKFITCLSTELTSNQE